VASVYLIVRDWVHACTQPLLLRKLCEFEMKDLPRQLSENSTLVSWLMEKKQSAWWKG